MTRKPQKAAWRIEAFEMGQWLWVISPDFKSEQEAQAHIDALRSRDAKKTEYRIVPA